MKLITCIHLGVMSLIARDSFFALSLCFLAMMIAIILGLLLFIQFLHHRSKSDLEALRNRLAADLHDDIGASLSQLSVLGEVLHCQLGNADPQIKATLTAVCRTSNEAMDAMSQIVWATNPQYDSLTNLISRMRRFASEILPAAGIEFSFQAPHLDLNLPLKSELRRHLFLIFKESLNNIVRHSGGSFASIEFRVKGSELTLLIRDNGHGFHPTILSDGNGLKNLERRARSLRAQFYLDSTSRGTTVLLCVPHKQAAWLAGWIASWQKVMAWATPLMTKSRSCAATANTYLNRGVTPLMNRPTLHPSLQKTIK